MACAITTLGTELAGSESNPNAAKFHVKVEGRPRDLHPILRDEVYRIAGEALRNALKHAQAQRIEVEIRYDVRQLRLRSGMMGRALTRSILMNRHAPDTAGHARTRQADGQAGGVE